MSYLETIRALGDNAEQLELAYQQAVQSGQSDAFAEAMEARRGEAEGNLLYAAWHYRLAYAAARARHRVVAWGWAIPLAVANGLILWLLSDDALTLRIPEPLGGPGRDFMPAVVLLAGPISAAAIVAFLTVAGSKRWQRAAAVILGMVVLTAYALLFYRLAGPSVFQEQYLGLMALHLLLLAWAGVGVVVLVRHDPENRFAFLAKSLEAFVVAGLFAIAGGLLLAVTAGLFTSLNIELPEPVVRLFLAGGAGAVAVLAVAMVYDPAVEPAQQSFEEGLSKLVGTLMRLLLPLAVLVLVVFLAFVPFNLAEPFENRDVLVIFNGMLFAVMALLVGATPVGMGDLSERMQTWLRRGIVALATLALVVGIYALIAILYRTAIDRPTPNRFAFIGWNVINIGILAALLVGQWRAGRPTWLPALHATFGAAMIPYVAWVLVVILAVPVLFRIDRSHVEDLPLPVQRLVFEEPYPLLLKCPGSPHIYLLEDGTKRWIKDIPTFEDKGFEWRDVESVPCADLSAVPDGLPIPPAAGIPPQP